jgi:hypothetical protein
MMISTMFFAHLVMLGCLLAPINSKHSFREIEPRTGMES